MSGQVFTLLGVLIGAAASYLVTAATERSRWRRQFETRWDERQFDSYLQFAETVDKFVSLVIRIVAGRGLFDLPQPLGQEEGLELLAQAEMERGRAFEPLLLVGDADTIAAARSLQRGTWRLERFARGLRTGSPDEWVEEFLQYQVSRDAYYVAARKSLGISTPFRYRTEDPATVGAPPE
ncbi:hypothetical protein ABT040_09485 [Streptomyces sp. NPDC002688]|uniref:hypothetical protein n=1 Tax=Streptomyces sp. NPDC002688 TaxID=3154423 RepID=UPI00331B5CC6